MGRGLVEPVDVPFNQHDPSTLLKRLADDFIEHGYDIRRTLKVIAMSSTYARESTTTREIRRTVASTRTCLKNRSN